MDIGDTIADESMQEKGVWMPYRDGAEFLIAYSGRKKYRDKIGKVSMKERRKNRGRDLTAAQLDEVTIESMIYTVLLDWRGVTKSGHVFPFNEENARWWLSRSAEVREFIMGEANNLSNFQPEGEPKEPEGPMAELKSEPEVPANAG